MLLIDMDLTLMGFALPLIVVALMVVAYQLNEDGEL